MFSVKPLENLGVIKGSIYDFPEIGDGLERHVHGDSDIHITIVTNGSVKITGDGWEMVGKPGNVLDFKPHQFHEIIALEPNTRIINLLKNP